MRKLPCKVAFLVYCMIKTERITFGLWDISMLPLAQSLWGNPDVCRFIRGPGVFSNEEIKARLDTEIEREKRYHVSYWPLFLLSDGAFIGVSGLRPYHEYFELGYHLLPQYWGKGYAREAAGAVVSYGMTISDRIYAGAHPENHRSEALLGKLGFSCIGHEFYAPTGLLHPLFCLEKKNWEKQNALRGE